MSQLTLKDFVVDNSGNLTVQLSTVDGDDLYIENGIGLSTDPYYGLTPRTDYTYTLGPPSVGIFIFEFEYGADKTSAFVTSDGSQVLAWTLIPGAVSSITSTPPADSLLVKYFAGFNKTTVDKALAADLGQWLRDNIVAGILGTAVFGIALATGPLDIGLFFGLLEMENAADVAAAISGLIFNFMSAMADQENAAGTLTNDECAQIKEWTKVLNFPATMRTLVDKNSLEQAWGTLVAVEQVLSENDDVQLSLTYSKDLVGKFTFLVKIVKKPVLPLLRK